MKKQYDYNELKEHMIILLAHMSNLEILTSWKVKFSEKQFVLGMGLHNLNEEDYKFYKEEGLTQRTYVLDMKYFELFMCNELKTPPKEWDKKISSLKENSEKILHRYYTMPKYFEL